MFCSTMIKSGNRCSVAECKNVSYKTTNVSYYTFPKDKKVQREWVLRCKRVDPVNANNARICSDHFVPEDYERDLKHELLGLPLRKKLKQDAVPSQKIPNWHGHTLKTAVASTSKENVQVLSARDHRCECRAVRKRALSTLSALPPKETKVDRSTNTEVVPDPVIALKDEIERLKVEVIALRKENANLKRSNSAFRRPKSSYVRKVRNKVKKQEIKEDV